MPPPLFPAGKPIRNESLTTCNGAGAVVHDPIQPDKQNNQIRSPGTRAVEVAGPHRIASRNLGNPPGQRQRKEEDPVSGPTPAQRFPQEPRVSSNLPRGKANLPPAGGTEVRAPRGPTRRSVFSLGPGAARSLFVKNKKRMGGALTSHQHGNIPRATTGRPYAPARKGPLPPTSRPGGSWAWPDAWRWAWSARCWPCSRSSRPTRS